MKRLLFITLSVFLAYSVQAKNIEKEYNKIISKYDVANEAKAVAANNPSEFWQAVIDNNELLAKFEMDLQKNRGAEKEALQKTSMIRCFDPQYNSHINDSLQGFCDSLLIEMGIAALDINCSLHVFNTDEADTFTALTDNGFAMCITSGLLETKKLNREMLMGFVAREFAHGVLCHHIRSFYAEAKNNRKSNILGGLALGFCGLVIGLDAYNSSTTNTAPSEPERVVIIDKTNDNANDPMPEKTFRYTMEQEYEADLIAYRFLENLGCEHMLINGLSLLSTLSDYVYNEDSGRPTVSSRIHFLKYVSSHPESGNKVNAKLRKKRESQY